MPASGGERQQPQLPAVHVASQEGCTPAFGVGVLCGTGVPQGRADSAGWLLERALQWDHAPGFAAILPAQ